MGPGIEVRKATAADIGALVGLMTEFYAEAGYGLDESWARSVFATLFENEDRGCAWLVQDQDAPIGHAVMTVRFTMEHGGLSGYIDDLFVRPGYRGRGAAGRVLRELEKECAERGCRALIVEVGRDNHAALRTYARLGMEHVEDGRILYRKLLPAGKSA